MTDAQLVEDIARRMYADSRTDYGTCSIDQWKKTSEVQRNMFRRQAALALAAIKHAGRLLPCS